MMPGQFVVVNEPGSSALTLPSIDEATRQVLIELNEHVEAGRWYKAFEMIGDVRQRAGKALIHAEDGFSMPCDRYLRRSMRSLPPEGRAAYRMLYEARAGKALTEARSLDPDAETKRLERIREEFALTEAAAEATDRLGDAYFEQGRFAEAALCWSSMLDDGADATLRVRVKLASAYARQGRQIEFERVRRTVRTGYEGRSVRIGGSEVVATVLLDDLAARLGQGATADVAPVRRTSEQSAPAGSEPAWSVRVPVGIDAKKMFPGKNRNRGLAPKLPSVVADGRHVYVNWWGHCAAVDRKTGRKVWSDKPTPIPARSRVRFMVGNPGSPWSLALAGGSLIAVMPPSTHNGMGQVSCRDRATGRVVWTTATIEGVKDLSFCPRPFVLADRLLAIGLRQRDLVLVDLDLATGRPIWQLPIGTVVQRSRRARAINVLPDLVIAGSTLYVLSNCGGLLAVDLDGRRVDWAWQYATRHGGAVRVRRVQTQPGPHRTSLLAFRDSKLIVRPADAKAMTVIDPLERRVVVSVPMAASERVVGIDDLHVYTVADELVARRLEDGERSWWSPHVGAGATNGTVRADRLALASPEGLFEFSRRYGKLVRIHESTTTGTPGRLVWTPDHLLCVSTKQIAAYRLDQK